MTDNERKQLVDAYLRRADKRETRIQVAILAWVWCISSPVVHDEVIVGPDTETQLARLRKWSADGRDGIKRGLNDDPI